MNRFDMGQSLVVRLLRGLLRDRLTDSGRMLFWLLVLATGVGMTSFIIRVYLLWCGLGSLLLVSIVMARLHRRKLQCQLQCPARATRGVPLELSIEVTNVGSRPVSDTEMRLQRTRGVSVEQVHQALPELQPDERARLDYQVVFEHRGAYTIEGVVQEDLFPWGLWRDLALHQQPRALLVYPSFHPLSSLDIPVGRRYQPGGIALTSYLGDSTEFLSTREFREGDSIRQIHWRSWARLGKPIVKEFQEEYFCRIALLLDTFALDAGQNEDTFEAAVSLAAAVADHLSLNEYVIDIFAAGPELYHFQAGRSLAYLQNVMDILACIEPSPDPPFESLEPVLLDHLENITTTVVVLLDWDERRERLLRVIRERGSEVKVLLVRDSEPRMDRAALDDYSERGARWLTAEEIWNGVEDL